MKKHKIIKFGLILPDKSEVRDYQLKIFNLLKKRKYIKIKLFKIDNKEKIETNYKKYFFFEKKFLKNEFNYNEIKNLYKDINNISFQDLKDYNKNDIDIFINLSTINILNNLKDTKKIVWEIVYGNNNLTKYPICFDDILNSNSHSQIRIIQAQKNKFQLVGQGRYNIKNYALLHQEFILEKTIPILIKSINILDENITDLKKINKFNLSFIKISFYQIIKYYIKNYFINKINKKNYNWNIFSSVKKDIFKLNNMKKNIFDIKFNNQYFADPFIYKYKNKIFIFFENFSKKMNKGHISFLEMSNKNIINDVLKKDYHLSYPFIFNYKKNIFLTPETSERNNLQIYKCKQFPHKWKLYKKKFIGQNFADPTFFLDKKKNLWLFLNKSFDKFKDHDSELYIYKVQNNFEKFIPHKLNPVIIDCRFARNAGNLFYIKNKLIKPCQINIWSKYGYGLQLLEITKLDLNNFKFKTLNKFENIHHLSVYDKHISWDLNSN